MGAPDLRFVGLATGQADGGGARLQVAFPSGRIRDVPLTRAQLLSIAQRALAGIELLDREAAQAVLSAPPGPRPCSECGHPDPGAWCPSCGWQR